MLFGLVWICHRCQRCLLDESARVISGGLQDIDGLNSDKFAYKFFAWLLMQMYRPGFYETRSTSPFEQTTSTIHFFSLYNGDTSPDVPVNAARARTNWHVPDSYGSVNFTARNGRRILTPGPLFHKATWERQVLWGCERIYSFSQKKIGLHTAITPHRPVSLSTPCMPYLRGD